MKKVNYFKIVVLVFIFYLFPPILTSSISLSDGDLITGPDGIKVYIINEHGYKRHILNPKIFEMYGHLKWSNIKEVDQKTLDSYKSSDLYRIAGDYKVFSVTADGKKHHFNMKPAEFIASGYSWNQIFVINEKEGNYYVWDSDIAYKSPITPSSTPTPVLTSTPTPVSTPIPTPIPTPTPVFPPIPTPTPTLTPTSISTPTPTPTPTPVPTPTPFQSGPPASWPEWLKKEWENNVEDIHRAEEWAKEMGWESLRNNELPQFLEWAKENNITIISETTGVLNVPGKTLIAIPGTDVVFETFKKIPSHLIPVLRNENINLTDRSCGTNAAVYKRYDENNVFVKVEVVLLYCQVFNESFVAHEFGHIVDFIGIRNEKGNDFSLGKTDEKIRALREEYNSVFRVFPDLVEKYRSGSMTAAPIGFISIYSVRSELENFADHFSDYINQPQNFRERAAKEPLLAEKYEFLKTKIFLGKEY